MNDVPAEASGRQEFSAGIFLVDKPRGATSFAMVRQVRRLLSIKKVGHAGTLDPFATGLLIICAGRPATRLIERFMSGRKAYRALLQLGVETETQDPEGRVVASSPVPALTGDDIRTCLRTFIGPRLQAPPHFSAAKYKGKPLYYYARKGIKIEKEPRPIEIFSLDFNGYDSGSRQLEITVTCSRGTYIRVLALDIGRQLGCGAHLRELRRLGSGIFMAADSLSGEALSGPAGLQHLLAGMIPVERAVAMMDAADDAAGTPKGEQDTAVGD